jgi:DMSO/TMAO reductase YedYZ molybdopterin-dependent catalytic subunit
MSDDPNEKLIAAKEKWAKEGRHQSADLPSMAKRRRLPPGQHLTDGWPVLDLGMQPNILAKEWKFTVSGLVEQPIEWGWEEFRAQPQTQVTADIHCVTSWTMYDSRFEGVSARHFLSVVRPRPEAKFLVCKAYDSYVTNLSLERFADEDVLLAHSWNGQPIPREHGGPVRIVLPKLYFWKSAKWLRHITFLEKDSPGFWEVRGYHNEGDPWKEERYSGE